MNSPVRFEVMDTAGLELGRHTGRRISPNFETLDSHDSHVSHEDDEIKDASDDPEKHMETLLAPNEPRSSTITAMEMEQHRPHGDHKDAFAARMTNMWSMENLALPMSYFVIGFAMTFCKNPVIFYAVHSLDASPAQINILSTLIDLPWSFKLMYGLLSDCVPIKGQRRKPYFIIGWTVFVLSYLVLACLRTPSIHALVYLSFVGVAGFMLADVMCDAVIVERSKLETDKMVGHMQGVGYTCRYVGNTIGAVLGTLVYNKEEFGWGLEIAAVLAMNALVPVVFVFPVMYYLADLRIDESHHRGTSQQFSDLWKMFQLRSVYRPMAFMALYNILQIPNAAWRNFLILGLNFTDWKLGVLSIASSVFSFLGIMTYRYCLFKYSWWTIYIITTTVVTVFSIFQILLILQVNQKMGIGDLAFALGDDVIQQFVIAVQFLPAANMYLRLCPSGAEGTAYAALTTFSNVAFAVAQSIGTLMAGIWDVSNTAIKAHEWDGLWKLSLLTSLLQPLGLVLLRLLPKNTEEQEKMQKSDQRSFWGGLAFAGFLLGALLWTISEALIMLG